MSDATDRALKQADALIRRNRVFVAGAGSRAEPLPRDDDLPMLTDVVTDREAALVEAPLQLQQRLDQLREELMRWLETELPEAVLKVTDGLADQLMADLTEQARRKLLPRLMAHLEGRAPDPAAED